PAQTDSNSAASRTVHVSGPQLTSSWKLCPNSPYGTRPKCGLNPYTPQHAAGILIEPAPSVPSATGLIRDAIAAADPPDEPPGVRSRFQGLRVAPKTRFRQKPECPNSGV